MRVQNDKGEKMGMTVCRGECNCRLRGDKSGRNAKRTRDVVAGV